MTPSEMDKKIGFILQMQAQSEANLLRSEAAIDIKCLRALTGLMERHIGGPGHAPKT
jgi:hypothetical protein